MGTHLLVALLYMVTFAARYGYSPLIVPLHLAQVALGCVAVGLVLRAVSEVAGRWGQLAVTLVGSAASSLYLVVLIGCAVTNEAWGWSVSLQLAREYASSLPSIVGNLPFARGWLYVGAALYVAAELVIVLAWWAASRRLVLAGMDRASAPPLSAASYRRPPSMAALVPVIAVLVLATFVFVARDTTQAAAEPFTALLTPPGLADPREARLRNARARQEYAPRAPFDHRNVIIIFADALRADHVSTYGYGRHTTPFLERLAATGKLRQVSMALSTCSFTACGVLSTLASRDTRVLEPGSIKLHDVLHDRGYRVNIIASTDNSSWYTLRLHYGETVDYFFDGFNSTRYPLNDDRSVFEGLDAVPGATSPAFFMFFLSSTTSLGSRLPEFRKWLPADVGVGAGQAAVQALINNYDNGILEADHSIERIFSTLGAKGYLAHSIVVILGDHGEGFGEHGHFAHTKYLYQEVLHIPLLIYDDTDTRYANLEFATQSDIAPTILDRLGLSVPAAWQGHSMLSEGPKSFSTHWTDRGRPWHAVVYRVNGLTYKYLYQTRWGSLVEELYELGADPGERRNLMLLSVPPGAVLDVVRRKAAQVFGGAVR